MRGRSIRRTRIALLSSICNDYLNTVRANMAKNDTNWNNDLFAFHDQEKTRVYFIFRYILCTNH